MNLLSRRSALVLPLGLSSVLAACAGMPGSAADAADPTGRADPEMLGLLQSLQGLGGTPIHRVDPIVARRQPTMADAVRARLQALGTPVVPRPVARVENITIEGGPNGPFQARIYGPARGQGTVPLIIYYHGGGFVIADLDTYDASARALAAETGAVVLSVHYHQAPEYQFPKSHEDALRAYRWALENSSLLGIDNRIALAGESAGGNLALDTAIYARDNNWPMPVALALIYPLAGTDTDTPSYREFGNAKPLSKIGVQWFVANFIRTPADLLDSRLDIIGRANLAGLPRTVIVSAEIDPLRVDSLRLADKLRAAGVPVTAMEYQGVTHEFFGADAVLTKARQAQQFVGNELKAAFAANTVVVPASAVPARGRARIVR